MASSGWYWPSPQALHLATGVLYSSYPGLLVWKHVKTMWRLQRLSLIEKKPQNGSSLQYCSHWVSVSSGSASKVQPSGILPLSSSTTQSFFRLTESEPSHPTYFPSKKSFRQPVHNLCCPAYSASGIVSSNPDWHDREPPYARCVMPVMLADAGCITATAAATT